MRLCVAELECDFKYIRTTDVVDLLNKEFGYCSHKLKYMVKYTCFSWPMIALVSQCNMMCINFADSNIDLAEVIKLISRATINSLGSYRNSYSCDQVILLELDTHPSLVNNDYFCHYWVLQV